MKDYDVRTYREFIPSFNVAASIKMRKSSLFLPSPLPSSRIQCGCIHKDAEIGTGIKIHKKLTKKT